MVIDKIGNIGKILRSEKPQVPKNTSVEKSGSDSVNISSEAVKAQEFAKSSESVKKTSDVRQEKIKEIKQKLADGKYDTIDNEILEKVAEKIASSFLR
ncbi:MAG: flagellar biosynthesis anti-sigma factor FlgM [Spirochaetia bacterium]|nr:flagellar biosynthesis anti-sigma factor FlgM [Spirochaetia bacterium]